MAESASRLLQVLDELRRRRVFRVAGGYAVVGWLVIQVAADVFPALSLPEWSVSLVVALVALGFPVAVVVAWAFDLTPQGVVRTPSRAPARSRGGGAAARTEFDSIAVLPFANLSPDPSNEYFSDGITEELINVLAQVEGLRVPARTSSFAFKGKGADVREVAQRLEVETVLEGSVRMAGDRVRITAQLVSAHDGYHLWSETYDREMSDIFAIQEEIARAIAGRLWGGRAGARVPPQVKLATGDTDAYHLYLKGLYAWNRRTEEGLRHAVGFFQRAIEADPLYAEAYAGMADAYLLLGYFGYFPPHEVYPKAKAAAVSALAMDDGLASAHTALAAVRLWYDWDWEAARQEFERALTVTPAYPTLHQWYGGGYLTTMGRLEEAIEELEHAHRLDPLSSIIATALGRVFYWSRQFPRAVRQFEQVLELNPQFLVARTWLGGALLVLERVEEAVEQLRRVEAEAGGNPLVQTELARAHARAGRVDQARRLLEQLREHSRHAYVSPDFFALIHAELHQPDDAFEWLERAYRERSTSLVTLRIEPAFDPLRADPRFSQLLGKVGLP